MLIRTGVLDQDLNEHIQRSEAIFQALIGPGNCSFGEMAAALRVETRDLSFQIDYSNELLRDLDPRFTGIRRDLMELSSRARMVGCAHNFFKEVSAREDEVRVLLRRARR